MRIRHLTLAASLALASLQGCTRQDSGAAAAAPPAFGEALREHLAAVPGRNLAAYEPTLADDVRVIFPNGEVLDGKQAVVAFHRDWFADRDWTFEPEVIGESVGETRATALVRYTYREDATAEPHRTWLALAFRLEKGGWRLYHDQNTAIEE